MAEAERQLTIEGAQRLRVAVASVFAGILLFGGDLWVGLIQAKDPTIGLLQGLKPALHGVAASAVDPRTAHEQFVIHHQTTLIFGFLVSALGALALIFPLRYLAAAERLRSPRPSPVTSYLALFGPLALAVSVPAYEIARIIGAHDYISHAARTAAAIDAATGGGVRLALAVLATLGQLAVAAGFVLISLRAMRVGLLTRMLGTIGIISGVLFLIPLTPLPVVQALWLVFIAALLLEFAGKPLPPAWAVAEARPWPSGGSSPRERRPARQPRGRLAPSPPPTPQPVIPRGPSPSASKKRKRRR